MAYDSSNVFAKILRGEIPCQKLTETETALAFKDLHPRAKVHILVIPKGPYEDFYSFHSRASKAEVEGFYSMIAQVIDLCELRECGFKLITRSGIDGGQEVPHYHVHVLGGQKLD